MHVVIVLNNCMKYNCDIGVLNIWKTLHVFSGRYNNKIYFVRKSNNVIGVLITVIDMS